MKIAREFRLAFGTGTLIAVALWVLGYRRTRRSVAARAWRWGAR